MITINNDIINIKYNNINYFSIIKESSIWWNNNKKYFQEDINIFYNLLKNDNIKKNIIILKNNNLLLEIIIEGSLPFKCCITFEQKMNDIILKEKVKNLEIDNKELKNDVNILKEEVKNIKLLLDKLGNSMSPENHFDGMIHAFPSAQLKFDKIKYNIREYNIKSIFISNDNFNLNEYIFKPYVNLEILNNLGNNFIKYLKEKYNINDKVNNLEEIFKLSNIYHWNNQFLISKIFSEFLEKNYKDNNLFTWDYFKKFYNIKL